MKERNTERFFIYWFHFPNNYNGHSWSEAKPAGGRLACCTMASAPKNTFSNI